MSIKSYSNIETSRKFAVTSSTDGDYGGDIVYFGGTVEMVIGTIYHYVTDGEGGAAWVLADADAVATCDGLLGVALGASSDVNGVLLRGMVTLDHDPGAMGDVLFLDEQTVEHSEGGDIFGAATSGAPAGNSNIIRVIGYCLHASSGKIWFNPDNTFVEVSA